MERDNHQEEEAQGVKICEPPSESNPAGKKYYITFHSCYLHIFLNHLLHKSILFSF